LLRAVAIKLSTPLKYIVGNSSMITELFNWPFLLISFTILELYKPNAAEYIFWRSGLFPTQRILGSFGLFMSNEKSSPVITQYNCGEIILDKGILAEAICPCN